jgi:integrase/recombinase XerC
MSKPQTESPTALQLLAAQYLEALAHERGASPHTLRAYRRELGAFTVWVVGALDRDAGPDALTHLHIRNWLGRLHSAGLAKASIARALAPVRSWIKWMARRGLVEQNVALLVSTPKRSSRLPRVPSSEQMNGLIESVCNQWTAQNAGQKAGQGKTMGAAWPARDRLILELLYGCGIRNAELTRPTSIGRTKSCSSGGKAASSAMCLWARRWLRRWRLTCRSVQRCWAARALACLRCWSRCGCEPAAVLRPGL